MKNKFYITTAIPYVNAAPHIGHALEFIQADVIAGYHRLLGVNVCLLSGGDENALKNVRAAQKAHVPLQEFIDTNTELFKQLAVHLNVRFDEFQKGSDRKHHYPSSQLLWNLCKKNNPEDIYKKSYEGLYCVGCEAFYTPEELNENGECPEHPGRKLEKVREENYFFRLSKYEKDLTEILTGTSNKYPEVEIIPEKRKHEVLSFLARGLKDISISRSNERAKNWGVPVPEDNTQRIYVWFDALNIYQSGIGFGWDDKKYHKWWPADVHVIGKGITRFHAVYWPAFLISAGLKLPKKIFVHEYFTVNGQKMSKTLGNVVDPDYLIDKYGADSVRYFFLAKFSPFNDGDFSENKFVEVYNSDLANGLGNLVSRVARLASQTENVKVPKPIAFSELLIDNNLKHYEYKLKFDTFRFDEAINYVWNLIKKADKLVNDREPWKKESAEKTGIINDLIPQIQDIATLLQPFVPATAEKILQQFSAEKIASQPPLFPRIK